MTVLGASSVATDFARGQANCIGSAGTNNCLPGSGYTLDAYWNCGAFYSVQRCYKPGNCLSTTCAHTHTWGWMSSDYDGGGGFFVYANVDVPLSFGGTGYTYVRVCKRNDCNDPTDDGSQASRAWTSHNDGNRHTIYGHGRA